MKKGEITRLRLLESASRLIAAHGIERLTLRTLAEHADVSAGLITRYFSDFSGIFAEVVIYVFDQARAHLQKAPSQETAKEKLERVARQNFEFFAVQNPHYNKCLMLSYVYVGIHSGIRAKHIAMITEAIAAAGRLFKEMANDVGKEISDEEAAVFGRAFMQQLEGGLIHCSFLRSKAERKEFMKSYLRDQQTYLHLK